MKLAGNRQILGHLVPFLVGANANRVAPPHIFNGFLAASFDIGPSATKIIRFIKAGTPPPPHLSDTIYENPDSLRAFADALDTILNPDRRIFPSATSSSLFPLSSSLISDSPADDQLGRQFASLASFSEPELLQKVRDLITQKHHDDIMAKLGAVLSDGYSPVVQDADDDAVRALLDSGGAFGKAYMHALVSLVVKATETKHCTFSAQLVGLGRAICIGAYLAALRVPVLMANKPRKWTDMVPCFVSGTRPPGDVRSPSTRLSIRCFALVVDEVRSSLISLIHSTLEKVRVPRNLPSSQRGKVMVKTAFPNLSGKVLEQIFEEIRSSQEIKNITKRVGSVIYPADHLSKYFRTVGRMLGVAGPDRGFGGPRFLLETPLLGTLVQNTIGNGEALSYGEWIDEIYNRFGLILGVGREVDPYELLRDVERPGPLDRAIQENHGALRSRLITAGLAAEYSDGETQVFNRRIAA